MEDRRRRRTGSLPVAFLVALLAATPLCSVVVDAAAAAKETKTVAVVGAGECADCASKNIKTSDAFQGLSVVINCKGAGEGDYQSKAVGKLDKDGKFAVNLPTELLAEDGDKPKVHCFAQLHGGGSKNVPCPTAPGTAIEAANFVLKSRDGGHHTFTTAGKLRFSSGTCAAAWFWHHPWFSKPKYSPAPPVYTPTPPVYTPPVYKPPPVYTPPVYHPAPPVYTPPVYHPAPPVYTPPVYHPAPPVYTPPVYHPAPPVYKPPVYKPTPLYKPPCPPIYIYKPPIPKLPPFPPVYTKPWPTVVVPKFPPVYTKPLPPFPPKYFYYPHPKSSWFPPSYGWPPKSASPTYALPKHPFFPPAGNVGKPKP